MKRIFAFLVLLALVVPWARGADAVDIYLRGEMNGWECLEEYRFATTDGVNYTLTVPDYTAGHEFKIASADWHTVNYGGETQNFAIIPDFECQLYPSDYNLIISNDLTDVNFNFNIEEGTIFVTGNPVNAHGSYDYDLYVIGLNVNGQAWVVGQEDAKFTYEGDGIFTWSGEQLGSEFKLNDGTWMDETHNWGGNGRKLALGEPYQLISGASSSNIILEGGTTISNPHIVFDAKTETIVVTRSFDQNSPDTSADNPMSVDEMLDNGVPQAAQYPVYLTGYIVGYAPGDDMSSAVFSSGEGDYAKTNIILASNRNEDDYIFCVPVELPAGDVRNALNLVDNPGNLGAKVTVRGSWERYLQGNGLKSVDWYTIDRPTVPDNFTISIDPAPGTYSELPETFTVTFSGSQDGKTLTSIGKNTIVANPVLIYLPDSENRYQCSGTFQGNTLTVTTNESVDRKLKGDYKFEIRAGGVYFVWDDDTKTKCESSTYTFTVEPEETHAVRLLSADPADGSTVESLKTIKTYWSTNEEVLAWNYYTRVSVYDSDSQTEVTQGEITFDWDDTSLFIITFKDEITAPGNYTVMIPENALMDESGNGVGEAATLNYHIRKNIQHEVTFNGSSPADGSILDSLSEIAIAWNVETDEYNLTDESAIHLFNVTDNVEIPIYDIYSFTDITNDPLFIVGMDIEPEIVKAGEYELTIPDGFLRDMDGNTYGEGITLHYTIRQNAANTVATPSISLEVAADARSVEVTLSTDTEDATLWYGIDNDDPEAMTEYSAPFTLTQNGTVYAQARKEGLFDSEVVSHEVSGLTAGKVSFSYDGRYMTLSSDDETEVHYHTGDGNWRPYTQPFDMKGLNTVYAYGRGEGIDNSAEVSYTAKSYGREGEAYLSKGGSLLEAYLWTTNEEIDSWTEMTLHGYLYDYDYQWLRLRENIETLDLSDVTVDNAYNIPNSAFANMSMVTVRLPKTFSAANASSATAIKLINNNIFSNCKNLAAIYWDATVSGDGSTLPMPESLVSSITNKNALIYTNSETSVLTAKNAINNIVIGGRAEKLILTEGDGPWYCPEAFTADKVRYARSFTKTTGVNGECAGWETIALPFDVQSITHDKGNLHPFAEDVVSNMRFWLFSPATPDWEPVSEIRANNPYLIAMPNNTTYDEAFSLAGDVTFSAENVQIPATPDEMSSSLWDDMMMTPNFQNLEADGSLLTVNDTYYNGNNPGSMFVSDVRDVRPFEAYLTGGTRRAIPIFDPSRTDTSSLLPTFADASLCAEVTAEGLRLTSLRDRTVEVFSSTGVRVAVATLRAAEPQTLRLVPGIYIVAGRKVML